MSSLDTDIADPSFLFEYEPTLSLAQNHINFCNAILSSEVHETAFKKLISTHLCSVPAGDLTSLDHRVGAVGGCYFMEDVIAWTLSEWYLTEMPTQRQKVVRTHLKRLQKFCITEKSGVKQEFAERIRRAHPKFLNHHAQSLYQNITSKKRHSEMQKLSTDPGGGNQKYRELMWREEPDPHDTICPQDAATERASTVPDFAPTHLPPPVQTQAGAAGPIHASDLGKYHFSKMLSTGI